MEREIKNGLGIVMGRISDEGDKKRAYDRSGIYLGYYDKQLDTTYDRFGNVIGLGEVLVSLIL